MLFVSVPKKLLAWMGDFSLCTCVCACAYLLDILLEHAQLQSLVQSNLSMLPNILETPLMVENLVNHIQDAVNLRNNSNVNWTVRF